MKISKKEENKTITIGDVYDSLNNLLHLSLQNEDADMTKIVGDFLVNRPALALMGHFAYFANTRIQVFGAGEMAYIYDMPPSHQYEVFETLTSKDIPGIIITRNLEPTHAMMDICFSQKVPLITTDLNSNTFTSTATVHLQEMLAPKVSIHGTLMEVNGMGVLILGESGVGKSECALALIKNGHSLIADDLVYVRRIGEGRPMGTSSKLSRGYMECRGIGIINISQLFGIQSVRKEKRIDLVVKFKEWSPDQPEERTGLDSKSVDILGVDVSLTEIPVRPGRDMAKLVEVAALVHASKLMGHDSAKEFNDNLIRHMSENK
jgi:HPr kinase/phosphorylase